MRTVHKYQIDLGETVLDGLPFGSEVLAVQAQRDRIQIWMRVDLSTEETEERTFYAVGTGDALPDVNLDYKGTVQLLEGVFVWHVFERAEDFA